MEPKHVQPSRPNFTSFAAFSSEPVWDATYAEHYAPALAIGVPLGVLLWDDAPLPTDAMFL